LQPYGKEENMSCEIRGVKMRTTGVFGVFAAVAIVLFLLALTPSAHSDPGGSTADFILGQAPAGEMPLTGAGSASCVSTPIDTNEDGVGAFFCPFEQGSNLGPINGQVTLEFAPLSAPVTCPEGNLELTLVVGSGFKRFTESGDLLYFQYTSGTTCVDLSTGSAVLSQEADFTGGTGPYANATGSFGETSTGTIFMADPALRAFIVFPYELAGTIIIP
jgi:hypothetical protein